MGHIIAHKALSYPSTQSPQQPNQTCKTGSVLPISQVRKLRLQVVKAAFHMVRGSGDSNSGLLCSPPKHILQKSEGRPCISILHLGGRSKMALLGAGRTPHQRDLHGSCWEISQVWQLPRDCSTEPIAGPDISVPDSCYTSQIGPSHPRALQILPRVPGPELRTREEGEEETHRP